MKVWSGKIPLSISPSFWVLALLIGWINASSIPTFLLCVLVVFISVIVHEYGHAITAKLWGQRVEVELGPLGGLTSYHGPTLSRVKEFLVVFCGPLFGLCLFGFSTWMRSVAVTGPLSMYFWSVMVYANLIWTVLNLLPVHPLDGGKLMAILFEGIFGLKGMRFSYFLSGIFGLLFAAYFLFIGQMFAGAIFILCAFESFSRFKKERFFRTTASENLFDELKLAQVAWQTDQKEKATSILERIIREAKPSEALTRGVEMLANFLMVEAKTQEAYDLLLQYKKRLSVQGLKLLQLAAYKLDLWEKSLEAGKEAFSENHDVASAVLNAYSASHLGDVELAVNWLRAVKRSKLVNFTNIVKSPDLNAIRQDPLFQQFLKVQ